MRTDKARIAAAMKAVAQKGCNPYDSHPSYVVEYQSKWKSDVRRHNDWVAKQHAKLEAAYAGNREMFV